jgi:hypothetical protein
MRVLLLVVFPLVALVALAGCYAFFRLKRLAQSPGASELIDSVGQGLAIPMRDCDTRPRRKEP